MSSSRSDVVTQFVRTLFSSFVSLESVVHLEVLRLFQGCFKDFMRLSQGRFKGISRVFLGVSRMWCFKGVSKKFQGYFKEVSGMFQGS